MKAFPNPLTPAEEKKYIQRYTEGDLEAKHILIERNLRLVAHVIRKYQNTSEDPEDLISIGTIGLIKAIITFDPEKGNRLAAYASRCVENEVLMYLRARKKCSHEISLYEPIGTDREGNEVNLYDIIESTETDIPERIHLKDNIQKLYEKLENELSPREKLVLKMRYGLYQGEEYTQREIAEQLGIGRNSAREAICVLHGMGVVERKQGSGNYVAENIGQSFGSMIQMLLLLNGVTKSEICEFRRAMEKMAGNLLLENGIDEKIKQKLSDLLHTMAELTGEPLAKQDKEFHDTCFCYEK